MKELIDLTNSDFFYTDIDFRLETFVGSTFPNSVELQFSLTSDSTGKISKWQIIVGNCKTIHNIFSENYMPFIKLKLLNSHPLLWWCYEKVAICELQNYPNDMMSFRGSLAKLYEDETGNWLSYADTFYALEDSFKRHKKKTIEIPERLLAPLQRICLYQDVNLKIIIINEPTSVFNKVKQYKALIFGNKDVSPFSYNLGQPYIIAESFIVKRIN